MYLNAFCFSTIQMLYCQHNANFVNTTNIYCPIVSQMHWLLLFFLLIMRINQVNNLTWLRLRKVQRSACVNQQLKQRLFRYLIAMDDGQNWCAVGKCFLNGSVLIRDKLCGRVLTLWKIWRHIFLLMTHRAGEKQTLQYDNANCNHISVDDKQSWEETDTTIWQRQLQSYFCL